MDKNKLNPLVASSIDPTKISLTLKSSVPLILAVSALFKLDISEGYIDDIIEALVAVISGGAFFYGAFRRAVTWYKKKNSI